MKFISPLFLIIFCFTTSEAQINQPGDLRNGLITTKEKDLGGIDGSPYLYEEYKKGVIIFEDGDSLNVYLRYNVMDEEMEIKTDPQSDEVYKLPSDNVEFLIGDELFVKESINYEGERILGYFRQLYNGNKVRLVKKAFSELSEPVEARSGYESSKPARINIEEEYLLIFKDGRVEEVKLRRRNLRKAFDSNEVKEYLSDNKIRNEEDLIRLAEFFDRSK